MSMWLLRLKALVVTGLVGAVIGGLFGAFVWIGLTIAADEVLPVAVGLLFTVGGALFGGFAASGFGLLLTLTERRGSVARLSVLRSATLGLSQVRPSR